MEKRKRRLGDRKDGYLVRDLDGMHYIVPLLYPNRCDNEAYVSLRIDLTAMNEYLARKNETEKDFPYTVTLPFDEDLYYNELMKRVATSKRKESVNEVVADTSNTYGGVK